jgi:hypothetical protein
MMSVEVAMGQLNQALEPWIGQRVALEVWSGTVLKGFNERVEGVLEAADGSWLRLRREDGTVVCFAAYSVRTIEPAG